MSAPPEKYLAEEIKRVFGGRVLELKTPRKRRLFVAVSSTDYKEFMKYLAETVRITHISTMTGFDAGAKIEVMPHLFGLGVELTVRTSVPKDKPELDSVTDIYPGALLYEREVHDLLGVIFKGHPDLSRLILPEEWPEGVYPLRKDYKAQQPEPVRKG